MLPSRSLSLSKGVETKDNVILASSYLTGSGSEAQSAMENSKMDFVINDNMLKCKDNVIFVVV